MKRTATVTCFAATLIAALCSGPAEAARPQAPPSTPARHAVVAVAGGDYTDPADALSAAEIANWCGDPAAGACLLELRPGTYVVSSPLQVPDGVSLRGSGPENTEITSEIEEQGSWGNFVDAATILLGSGSSLRDLTVSNTSSVGGVAVIVTGSSRIRNARILAGGDGVRANPDDSRGDYAGIFVNRLGGAPVSVVVEDVTLDLWTTPAGGDVEAIGVDNGAELQVSRCIATVLGGAWAGGFIEHGWNGKLTIRDSSATAYAPDGGNAVECDSSTRIFGSSLEYAGDNGNAAASDCTVIGSELRVPVGAAGAWAIAGGNVASSLVQGQIDYTKVVGCWDENFDPIPDVLNP